jgi:hypothetical protein
VLLIVCSEFRWIIHKKFNIFAKNYNPDDTIDSPEFKSLISLRLFSNLITFMLVITSTIKQYAEKRKGGLAIPGKNSLPSSSFYNIMMVLYDSIGVLMNWKNLLLLFNTPFWCESIALTSGKGNCKQLRYIQLNDYYVGLIDSNESLLFVGFG